MAGTQKASERAQARAEQGQNAPARTNGKTIHEMLEDQRTQIARALPKTFDEQRFVRTVWTTVRGNKGLMEADPASLISAVMLSAQLGLEPGPLGHCYFVPFRERNVPKVQFILGYKGIIDLARRSGEIKSIEAREVREHDTFDYEFGLEPVLRHRPADGDRGKPTHYYGVCHFKDGGHYFEVLTVADVEAYRQRSKAGQSGPWTTDYSQMAKKTVIRRMAPYLPLNVEAARAVDSDEGIVSDLPTDGPDVEVTGNDQPIDLGEAPETTPPDDGEADSEAAQQELGGEA